MKKYDDNLFKMGEITKILGVTRKTLLVYENMGLLTPAVKDEQSGYRYYTADNMTQIRSIRSLQTLGLSLTEIAEYYYDTQNLDHHLERLMNLRASLDRNIQMLQVRAAKQGDLDRAPGMPSAAGMLLSQISMQKYCRCRKQTARYLYLSSKNRNDVYGCTHVYNANG